jgi:hypothetical protein
MFLVLCTREGKRGRTVCCDAEFSRRYSKRFYSLHLQNKKKMFPEDSDYHLFCYHETASYERDWFRKLLLVDVDVLKYHKITICWIIDLILIFLHML